MSSGGRQHGDIATHAWRRRYCRENAAIVALQIRLSFRRESLGMAVAPNSLNQQHQRICQGIRMVDAGAPAQLGQPPLVAFPRRGNIGRNRLRCQIALAGAGERAAAEFVMRSIQAFSRSTGSAKLSSRYRQTSASPPAGFAFSSEDICFQLPSCGRCRP